MLQPDIKVPGCTFRHNDEAAAATEGVRSKRPALCAFVACPLTFQIPALCLFVPTSAHPANHQRKARPGSCAPDKTPARPTRSSTHLDAVIFSAGKSQDRITPLLSGQLRALLPRLTRTQLTV
jgi:hypothetical protein